MIDSPRGPFKVELLGRALLQLRALTARAAQRGMRDQFLASFRRIVQQLETDPISWGDHTWSYKAAELEEYHRLYEMLSVRYGVDEANSVVYLKDLKAVLSHPLADR